MTEKLLAQIATLQSENAALREQLDLSIGCSIGWRDKHFSCKERLKAAEAVCERVHEHIPHADLLHVGAVKLMEDWWKIREQQGATPVFRWQEGREV